MDQHLKARVVSYADDFVILCRGTAAEALAVTQRWMRALKLTLNEKKTRVCDATQAPFDFLGYTFGPTVHRPTGRTYVAAQPSRKAMARFRVRVRGILRPGNQAPWPEVVADVNRVVRGWQRYFSYGTVSRRTGVGQVPAPARTPLPPASAQTPWARDAAVSGGEDSSATTVSLVWLPRIGPRGRMPWRETSPRAVCWKTARTVRRALTGNRAMVVGIEASPERMRRRTHPRPVAMAPAFDSTACSALKSSGSKRRDWYKFSESGITPVCPLTVRPRRVMIAMRSLSANARRSPTCMRRWRAGSASAASSSANGIDSSGRTSD